MLRDVEPVPWTSTAQVTVSRHSVESGHDRLHQETLSDGDSGETTLAHSEIVSLVKDTVENTIYIKPGVIEQRLASNG